MSGNHKHPHHDLVGHCHGGHGHHHNHNHSAIKNIKLAFFLNLGFAMIELVGGFLVNSVAILSDALHDLGDSFALGIAWFLEKKSAQHGDLRYSYGYRRWSALSALLTAAIIIIGSLWVIAISIPRLLNPEQPHVDGMLLLAVLGLAVNGFAFLRMGGESLSERAIKWHLLEDVMGWILVLVSALVMRFADVPILDPLLAIGLALWVSWNISKTLKETLKVFLQAVPDNLSIEEIESHFTQWSQVKALHHTHVWSVDGVIHILTSHVVLSAQLTGTEVQELKNKIKLELKSRFKISEATLEVELPDEKCVDPHHH